MNCQSRAGLTSPARLWVAAVIATVACSHALKSTGSRTPARPDSDSPSVTRLRRDVDAILATPALAHGYWGVLVRSLKTRETLYSLNPGKLMMPASNMKIVTLAAAVERLGWDYVYETRVLASGRIENGTLDGDLIVIGSGDPSFTAADGAADRIFGEWADRLKQIGVRTIAGGIVGDDTAMEHETLGFGWSWDDLQDDYAAGVAALQFNENMVRVTVSAGPSVGDIAGVAMAPAGSSLVLASSVITGVAGGEASIAAHRLPGSPRLELAGSIPLGSAPATARVSVDSPALFFVNVLRAALIAHGIDIKGAAGISPSGDATERRSTVTPVATHQSAPLSTLAVRLMKASQNQYAETFLKTTGGTAGAPTAAAGRSAVQATLEKWGVPEGSLIQRDGSGLSRYDYITPEVLVTILAHVSEVEKLRGPFQAALPVAGRDGSLANRMKGTPAEGNARAKTGSLSNVRALSGYVTSADGEPLVFAIMANNFDIPSDLVVGSVDAIVVRLAQFKR